MFGMENSRPLRSDGEFKTIEVRIKDRDYRVTHRKGYFAN
jgi:hypothetical protein